MGFLSRLFGKKKTLPEPPVEPVSPVPELPIVPLPAFPREKPKSLVLGKFVLEEKLGELLQARPQRKAQLWQGRDRDNHCVFLALVEPGHENQSWLIERLGGEEHLARVSWGVVNTKGTFMKFGPRLVCLSFQTLLGGRYQLLRRLSEDLLQETWKAKDIETNSPVYCVLSRPGSCYKIEGQIVKRSLGQQGLTDKLHPQLLDVLEEGICSPIGGLSLSRFKSALLHYAVTEYVSDFNLALAMTRPNSSLTLSHALTLLHDVGGALNALEKAGWLHRNVRPEHIWIGEEGAPQGRFFLNGYSLVHVEKDIGCTALRSMENSGTYSIPRYMAPELVESEAMSSLSDQFSLGVVLYEMLSGKNPFSADTTEKMLQKLSKNQVEPLAQVVSSIPIWFSEILARSMATERAKRFVSFAELLKATALALQERQEQDLLEEGEEITTSPVDQPLEPSLSELQESSPENVAEITASEEAMEDSSTFEEIASTKEAMEDSSTFEEIASTQEAMEDSSTFEEIASTTNKHPAYIPTEIIERPQPGKRATKEQPPGVREPCFTEFQEVASPADSKRRTTRRFLQTESPAEEEEHSHYLIFPPYQPMRLTRTKNFRIGRDDSNDLILPAGDVSRFHATIEWDGNIYLLTDLGSSNGTFVNEDYIERHILADGDRVTIGTNTILYQQVRRGTGPNLGQAPSSLKNTLRLEPISQEIIEITSQKSFSGNLAEISLWQILQLLATDEKSGCLILQTSTQKTQIYFLEGLVVHAEDHQGKGREAFYRSLFQQEGAFAFDSSLAAVEVTMSDYIESLLLEGARRLDEQSRKP